MYLNKRGMALVQVLMVAAILAGVSTMILRAVLARTMTARQTHRAVKSQMIIESAMAQVNSVWAAKKPEVYAAHLEHCVLTCNKSLDKTNECVGTETSDPEKYSQEKDVTVENAEDPSHNYVVTVRYRKKGDSDPADKCIVEYVIKNPEYL